MPNKLIWKEREKYCKEEINKALTIQMRKGDLVQKLKCLLPNDVSLANLNRSGSVIQYLIIHKTPCLISIYHPLTVLFI